MSFSPARELGFALHDVCAVASHLCGSARARTQYDARPVGGLVGLQRCQGVSQNELAVALDLAPITLARLVDKLTAAGLVERRDDANDRRIHRLYLTDKSAPALDKLRTLGEGVMNKALEGLDENTIPDADRRAAPDQIQPQDRIARGSLNT